MLTVEEALAKILEHASCLLPTNVALEESLGLVLAEDISSDVDSPPHDKSIVDGYAVRTADVTGHAVELNVIEEIVAGQVPTLAVESGQATRIMTGAPLPAGADAIVMVERTTLLPAEAPGGMSASVRIDSPPVVAGQNIVRQGASMRRGDMVLTAGRTIRPIEIGILAEVGRTRVGVIRKPTVAILSTGNELTAIHEIPQADQIRNSNGPMLMALAERTGANVMDLGIGRDDLTQLRDLISQGLTADVLILSGGVSAGVLDLVPQALADLGVKQVFHKVSVKPGKPLWFGIAAQNDRPTLVFGLPGNPVSSLVCFELFARPAIAQLRGQEPVGLERIHAPLTRDFEHRGDRATFHPARLIDGKVELLSWKGSGDLRTLAEANTVAHFPPGNQTYPAGTAIEVLLNL